MMRVRVLHPHVAGQGRDPDFALSEAVSLTAALPEVEVVAADVAPLSAPRAGHLFGRGRVDDEAARIKAEDIGLVIVNGPLTPVQQRNLERAWSAKVLDRTGLILEIFGARARTREGVMQVELAHLTYQKGRLVRSWTHLERQRGGGRGSGGFMGGPGERQIESDRRALDDRITALRRKLDKVARTRELHRKVRRDAPYPVVALVGYTNAGKSTLFNRMSGADVMARDMLFATLDPTMRAVELPSGKSVILSDTVGFISDLPTELVAAFRATLEEVLEADLILHVRDMAHEKSDEQASDVWDVLRQLGVEDDEAVLEVRNKLDLLSDQQRLTLDNQTQRDAAAATVSALTGEGVAALCDAIEARLGAGERCVSFSIPLSDGRALAWLHEHGRVEDLTTEDTDVQIRVHLSDSAFGKFSKAFGYNELSVEEAGGS